MTINKTKADNIITLALEGRLDTTTAPELDKEIDVVIEVAGNVEPTFDILKKAIENTTITLNLSNPEEPVKFSKKNSINDWIGLSKDPFSETQAFSSISK